MSEPTLGKLAHNIWQSQHMNFVRVDDATRKTECWDVRPRADLHATLGEVKWFGRWTIYAFFPAPGCVFERHCLRAIADFCEMKTTEQRKAARRK